MSARDIIRLPGTGMYARRNFVTSWRAAGSPPLVSAGRLYLEQKRLFDGWRAGLPGFNPADDPDDETQRLAHVRFVAGDLANPARDAAACERAGLVRPYAYEPWHVELPGDPRRFNLVRSLPTSEKRRRGGGMTAQYYRRASDGKIGRFADGVKVFGTQEDYQHHRFAVTEFVKKNPHLKGSIAVPPLDADPKNFVNLSDHDWALQIAVHGGVY
ncbi:hypothetical protein E4U02_14625 [Microbacterium paludicola]|uniref:Uncharacterized protein n=1 Tax=Microbacterium paludicola TaxID=300019 RepID=A0A4Y9FNM8_9MICO|nr:hypothetical protein [Microbacterium paludicola]MBF0817638.1 hypothetical protein [Microbacterium paludicola]TFU30472.1 hypothetical protein E4U02_14625 [Microbacterium paludicola]